MSSGIWFRDHIIIEAQMLSRYYEELQGYAYKWESKNRILIDEDHTLSVAKHVFSKVFADTFGCEVIEGGTSKKLKLSVLNPGGISDLIYVWEEYGKVLYTVSGGYRSRKNPVFEDECRITAEELNQRIDQLGADFRLSSGYHATMGPAILFLELIDRNGNRVDHQWDTDHYISKELSEFMGFIYQRMKINRS